MNTSSFFCAALFSAVLGQTCGAAINVSGTTAYQQTFDVLPTAAALTEFNWTDDTTIPGFYLHRSKAPAGQTNLAGTRTTAGERPYVSDGALAANAAPNFHGFLSLGAFNATDRALGFCPTGDDGATNWSGGTLSIAAVFTNTGSLPTEITRIAYALENRRANSANTTAESVTLTYKLGAAATLLAELGAASATANFGVAGYTAVNGGSLDVNSANGFSTPTPPGITQKNVTLVTPIRVIPGQSVVLRWGNTNDDGTDAQVGIDNLTVNFTGVPAYVTAAVSNVVRDGKGTDTDPLDDTVNFDLTVDGSGTVSPLGWKISSPAVLDGTTGTYGVLKQITGVPIAEFAALTHTLAVRVDDQANAAFNTTVTVTTPWCRITPVVSAVVRDDKGNLDPADDTWGYTLTVNGSFTGEGFNSNNANLPSPGSYGVPVVVNGLPVSLTEDSATLSDSADLTCTASVLVVLPRVIGRTLLGTERLLYSNASGVPSKWLVDEASLTQFMTNGGGAPAKEYRSEVVDLTAVADVKFTATLTVTDRDLGYEAADTFNAWLIIDGNAAAPVSLISRFDVLPPADGVLTGAELMPFPREALTDARNMEYDLKAFIPASAASVQLVVSGNNDSDTEDMTLGSILFSVPPHSLDVTPVSVTFDNKGTVDPADDEFRPGLEINGYNPAAGSTGWTSSGTPASGLYSAPNPVFFGPYLQAEPARDLTITDNGVPSITSVTTLPPPVPQMIVRYVSGFRVLNGPGPDDDTGVVTLLVSAPIGGPKFTVSSDPSVLTVSNDDLTAAASQVTVTYRTLPEHGDIYLLFTDASYPESQALFFITVNTIPVTSYVVARMDLGSGLTNVGTAADFPLSPRWWNYPGIPAMELTNGGGVPAAVLSEVIDLSAVDGPVEFSGTLHVRDWISGFETEDSFKAELLITDNGGTGTVNLIAPYDTNSSSFMEGGALAADDEFNAAKLQDGEFTSDFPLHYTIPDSATAVQLVLTGTNNSNSEVYVVRDCLFAASSSDNDGDGVSNGDERIMGTSLSDATSVTRLTQTDVASGQFAFTGVAGRFYRIYMSDDSSPATHLEAWKDSGLPTVSGAGAHTVTLPVAPGQPRRFLRLHVMETDGPWPAVVP